MRKLASGDTPLSDIQVEGKQLGAEQSSMDRKKSNRTPEAPATYEQQTNAQAALAKAAFYRLIKAAGLEDKIEVPKELLEDKPQSLTAAGAGKIKATQTPKKEPPKKEELPEKTSTYWDVVEPKLILGIRG